MTIRLWLKFMTKFRLSSWKKSKLETRKKPSWKKLSLISKAANKIWTKQEKTTKTTKFFSSTFSASSRQNKKRPSLTKTKNC